MRAFIPNPEADAGIFLSEVPEPEPRADQALIAVEAYSPNRGETFLLEKPRPGWRPGQDVAGRVVQAAADGSGPSAGARVVAHAWDGGWAPRVAVATGSIAALPGAVSAEQAATLGVAGLTAIRLLRVAGSLAGRRVLVTGASGKVGHFLVELAAAQGARITALSASPERGARLLELGAEEVRTRLEEATGDFDLAFESVGGELLRAVIGRVISGGTVIWLGQASRQPVTLDFFALPARITLRRFGYWPHDEPDRVDLEALVRLVAAGRLHPELGLVAGWEETPAALVALRNRRVRGSVVLTVPPGA
jgi:NADPH:quinone reductase-like Zn-dependent oxidoreductase